MSNVPGTDCIVIGSGVTGSSSAIYAGLAGRNVEVITGDSMGQLTKSPQVMNYPGVLEASGLSIMQTMREQAERSDAKFLEGEVVEVDLASDPIQLMVRRNDGPDKGEIVEMRAKSLIIAMGSEPKSLGVAGEASFLPPNMGIHYCGLCESALLKAQGINQAVVIGGGDSAVATALYLSNLLDRVIVLTRSGWKTKDAKRLSQLHSLIDEGKVTWVDNARVIEFDGDKQASSQASEQGRKHRNVLREVVFEVHGKKYLLPTEAVFLAIGWRPNTEMFKSFLQLDKEGYILVDERQRVFPTEYCAKMLGCKLDNVCAAGQVTRRMGQMLTGDVGQAIVAAAAGTVATFTIGAYLDSKPAAGKPAAGKPAAGKPAAGKAIQVSRKSAQEVGRNPPRVITDPAQLDVEFLMIGQTDCERCHKAKESLSNSSKNWALFLVDKADVDTAREFLNSFYEGNAPTMITSTPSFVRFDEQGVGHVVGESQFQKLIS